MHKNIILSSLKESFALIWQNKFLFSLLFIIQIIFFVIFSLINLNYQTKMLEKAKEITDYLSNQRLDEFAVSSSILQQKSILGDDPLLISRNFNEILKIFRIYLVYIFVLLILFTSFAWTLTNRLVHKNNLKQSIKYFFKAFIILLFYLGLIFLFLFSLVNISLNEITESSKILARYLPFLIFSIVLVYFMFISIALLHKVELSNMVQKTLSIGIKKAHYTLSVYFINIFLFSASATLLFYSIENNLFILFLSIILLIFSFVFGRVFMINVVEKLS